MTIFKQYKEVINGTKTQTRRFRKMAHVHVGTERAAVPKRSKPAWWVRSVDKFDVVNEPCSQAFLWLGMSYSPTQKEAAQMLTERGYVQVRIVYTRIWQERLQDISLEDALAEGVASVEEYAALWDSINKAKGTRWEDDPLVWCYEFERTPQLVKVLRGREVAL